MKAEKEKIDWNGIISLFNTIKSMYALCEETDSELNTNLQPLNEFRAALDHLMRIVAIEKTEEYAEKDAYEEAKKLKSHLRRAFFDICDMASINYRNKIIDVLEKYDVDEIQHAIPNYYSEIRPRIELISEEIAILRTEKRFSQKKDDDNVIEEYPKIIEELQQYYKIVNSALSSLIEIRKKSEKAKKTHKFSNIIIPIIGLLVGFAGVVVAILK